MSAWGRSRAHLELENASTLPNQEGFAIVDYAFTGSVTGNGGTPYVADNSHTNGMTGSLRLSINWGTAGFPASTTFTPTCLQELQIDPGSSGAAVPGAYEAEIEGIFHNFPGETADGQRGLLTLNSEWDPETGKIGFSMSMELGTTCAEPGYPNETEVVGHFSGENFPIAGAVKVPPYRTAGRASLPAGVTPGPDPGAPCDGSVGL